MKSLKKLLAVLVVVTLMAGMLAVPAFAASFKYEDEAKTLYDLGLFKGKSETAYVPALEDRLLREESVAILLRIFKLEEEALKMDEKEAKDLLNQKFKDADEIAAWAVKYVAYAVKNEIIAGRPDGKFAPKDNLLGREFAKMVLTQLGYKQDVDFDYKFSIVKFAEVANFSTSEAAKLDEAYVTRDDIVGMSFSTLDAEYVKGTNAGKSVLAVLAQDASFREKAIDKDLITIVSVEKVADQEILAGEKVVLPDKLEVTYSDGVKEKLAVKWDLTAVKPNDPGAYKAKGTITGYSGEIAVNVTVIDIALDVNSVTCLSNSRIKVVLNTAANKVRADAFSLKAEDGTAVAINELLPTSDMKTIYVTTASMVPGNKYTLTINDASFDFVAQVAVTAKLSAVTAVSKNNVEVELTFSANVDPLTALNPANYAIDNNLNVVGVTAGSSADKVVLITNAQTAGTLYKVTVSNVVDEIGNSLDTSANVVYFGGKAADTTAPTAQAFSDTNTRFKISFTDNSDMDASTVLDLANYSIDGGLTILSTSYDADTKTVSLTTTAQTAGTLYTVTLNNIADKFGNKIAANSKVYFGGKAADTKAPTVATISSVSNKSVEITFADDSKMDEGSVLDIANYAIEGLSVVASSYTASTKKLTLTTAPQTAGTLYKVVINNVKDEYGNTIASNTTVYFGGRAIDTSNPTYTAIATKNTEVKVMFDDPIDKATVKALNFKVVDLGYALSAKLESDNKTVTITTLAQTSGKIYTLEVRNVTNTDGTAVKSDSKATFAGIGAASTAAPKVQAAMALDNKYVVVTLDSDLAYIPTVVIKNYSDGSEFASIAASDVSFYEGSNKKIIAKLPDGKVFVEGTLYKAVLSNVIGTNGVPISTDNNTATFAGNGTAPVGASVLAAVPVDNTTIKVLFDKPVKMADASVVTLFNQANDTAIKYGDDTAVTGQNCTSSSDKKEITVFLKKAGTTLSLAEGTIYTVRIDTTDTGKLYTDVTGLAIKPATDQTYAKAQFAAVSSARTETKILAAVAQSKYVIDVAFNIPISIVGDATTIFTVAGDNRPVVVLAKVVDNTKVRLYFNETGKDPFVEGTVYTIKYQPTDVNYIVDKYDATNKAAAADVNFAAMGTVASGPAIAGVSAVNANTINVTLDQEALAGTLVNTNITLKEGSTTIGTGDYAVVAASDNKSFKIILTNNIFKAGSSYSVALTTNVKDVSGLRDGSTTAMTCGGIGNINLVLTAEIVDPNVVATLKDSSNAAVVGKKLILRKAAGEIVGAETPTDNNGQVSWTAPASGEYLIQATDGSVTITLIVP